MVVGPHWLKDNAFNSLNLFAVVEDLSLCQAGCRCCPATGGQCNDGSCEDRHGAGQVSLSTGETGLLQRNAQAAMLFNIIIK